LGDDVEDDALLGRAALDPVAAAVLHAIEDGHAGGDEEAEALESDVERGSLHELGALGLGEEERGEDRETLADGVEHAEGDGALRLGAGVVGLPRDDQRDGTVAGGDLEVGDEQQMKRSGTGIGLASSERKTYDAEAGKVAGLESAGRGVDGVDAEEKRPADDADAEDQHDGNAARPVLVAERGQDEHEDERDGVGRDRVELSLRGGVAEALKAGGKKGVSSSPSGVKVGKAAHLDDGREEAADGAEALRKGGHKWVSQRSVKTTRKATLSPSSCKNSTRRRRKSSSR